MKCVVVMGGNACGKTTLCRAAQARVPTTVPVEWIYADNDAHWKQPVAVQYKRLMALYADPARGALVVEGTRMYSTVYRAYWQSTQPRALYAAILTQSPDSMKAHMQVRRAAAGRRYRAEFWETRDGARALQYEGQLRYVKAAAAFQASGGKFADLQVFPIGPAYEGTAEAQAWLESVLTCA